jgi:hypothetical protein
LGLMETMGASQWNKQTKQLLLFVNY